MINFLHLACARYDWLDEFIDRLESGMFLVRPVPIDVLQGLGVSKIDVTVTIVMQNIMSEEVMQSRLFILQ